MTSTVDRKTVSRSFDKLRPSLSIAACAGVWLVLSGNSSCSKTPAPPATVDVTILHTNDIHSHLRTEPATSEKNPFNLGGLARLSTLVKSLRSSKPNSILLDAGDWSEGTTYYDVDAGANMLKIMSAIGYDAAVVGNHDFLNGPSSLGDVIETAKPSFPVLGANMNLTAMSSVDQTRLATDLVPSKIFTVDGIRIGVIGLLCDDYFYMGYFAPGVITDPVATASAISTAWHDNKQADVILLLSHNTFASNVEWAKTVPWVNAVISGHSHYKTPQPVATTNGGNPSYVAETKMWGQFLGDMTLTVTPSTGQVVLKSYTLHPVTHDIAEDSAVAALVEEQDTALATKFGKDIVDDDAVASESEMVQDDSREVPLSNLTADAYRAATGADIALESVQLNGVGIQPGALSTMQILDIAPHIYNPATGRGWTLKLLPLLGAELRGLLNLTFLADSLGLIGWVAESGALVSWSSASAANPVQSIKILDPVTGAYNDIDDAKTYQVAFHDGLLTAIKILISKLDLSIDLSQMKETGVTVNAAVLSFAQSKGSLSAADYLPGSRINATGVDLAFYTSDVALAATGPSGFDLNVTVHNIGLTASEEGQYALSVLRGPPNDVTGDFAYNNPDQTIPINSAAGTKGIAIPALAPGASAVVTVPWTNLAATGVYPLLIGLVGPPTANPANAAMTYHAHVGVP